ncbi:MAG TPA: hypothetical protein DCS43_11720 [Verrucomicrobia bacterium]|nr:hypothetical protein [Verrucomicrobiota bacterium]
MFVASSMMLVVAHSRANWMTGEIDWDPIPPSALMMEATGAVVDAGSILPLKAFPKGAAVAESLWVAPYVGQASTDVIIGAWRSDDWVEYDFWGDQAWSPLPMVDRPSRFSIALWGDRMNAENAGLWTGQTEIAETLIERDGLGDPERFLIELASTDWIGATSNAVVNVATPTPTEDEAPTRLRHFMTTWVLVSALLFGLLWGCTSAWKIVFRNRHP